MGARAFRILLADDEESVRKSLAAFLKDRGYEIAEASDGGEALRVLDRFEADAVVTDIRMPVLDGVGLLKVIRERRPGTAVILVTGFQDLESAIAATRHGAADYITKPYDLAQIAGVLKRIEESRRARAEAREKERRSLRSQWMASLGVLSAGIMHEINNPNTFIAGNAEIIKRKILPALTEPSLRKIVEHESGLTFEMMVGTVEAILTGSERITEIVRRAALLDHRRTPEETRPFDVRSGLVRALNYLRHRMGPGVRVHRSVPTAPVYLRADEEAATLIFTNLLSNAIEAVEGRADAELIVEIRDGEAVRLIVEDNGPGVPDEDADRIFEPFATEKRDRPGRGLGLFIVHQIVENLGGRIAYERRGGAWSRFTVDLPRAAAA